MYNGFIFMLKKGNFFKAEASNPFSFLHSPIRSKNIFVMLNLKLPQLSCLAIFPPIVFLNALKNDPDDPKLNSFARFNAFLPSDCSTATATPTPITMRLCTVLTFVR